MSALPSYDVRRKQVGPTPPDQLVGHGAVLSGARGIDIFDSILAVDDKDLVLRGFCEDAIVVAEIRFLIRAHGGSRFTAAYLIAWDTSLCRVLHDLWIRAGKQGGEFPARIASFGRYPEH